MTFFGEDDIDAMLAELGVPCVFGAVTVPCLVDTPDSVALADAGLGGGVIAGKVAVTIRTDSLPGIDVGSEITVDGASYKVRVPLKQGDGATTVLLCQEAA